MSYEDAKRLGIGHLHPAERDEIRPNSGGIVLPPHGSIKPDDGMNKTERDFSEMLKAGWNATQIAQWNREPITFRLAGRTRYTPDFLVWPDARNWDTRFTFVEVKGWLREDAAIKIKVVADLFPCFRWLLVYREGRHGWKVFEVTRKGIGTQPIQVPWIG